MFDYIISGDLVPEDYAGGPSFGIWSYLSPFNHDNKLDVVQALDNINLFKGSSVLQYSASPRTLNSTIPASYTCGCYDSEGYALISPLSDPSPCFTNGVLVNLLSLYFLIFGIIEIYKLRKQKNIKAKTTFWFGIKLGLLVLQLVFQLGLVFATKNSFYSVPEVSYFNDIKYWSAVGNFIVLLPVLQLSYIENYKSFVSSSVLIIYWVFSTVVGGFRIINLAIRDSNPNVFHFTILTTVNALLITILEIFSGPQLIPDPTVTSNF
ncbi:unnamed protein product [Ambrosiozyma monospora]|uniref:Unnamed protein product n=1 Tax=Ambrosiozyma monospora TaxID=43982 RepID=A0ACB5U691_AMBMO|nr:unnamed protein product [Ambrosiozyma monospora]